MEKEGVYQFDLRRWPKEAGHGVVNGIYGMDVNSYREGISPESQQMYIGGKALKFDGASLDVSGIPSEYREL